MLLVVVGIMTTSQGPLIFISTRVGCDGKNFSMYKFRTMYIDSQKSASITAPNDCRITRIGHFLRSFRIDELPQLINIIKGEMSIVGPRPEDPVIVKQYYTQEMLRTLGVRPGLTSPGTLHYLKNFRVEVAEQDTVQSYTQKILLKRIELDLAYFLKRDLKSDLITICQTIKLLVKKFVARDYRE